MILNIEICRKCEVVFSKNRYNQIYCSEYCQTSCAKRRQYLKMSKESKRRKKENDKIYKENFINKFENRRDYLSYNKNYMEDWYFKNKGYLLKKRISKSNEEWPNRKKIIMKKTLSQWSLNL